MSDSYHFTSESVSEGHPDKVVGPDFRCHPRRDPRKDDPRARVAAETLCNTGLVVLAGEITTTAMSTTSRSRADVIKDIGYDNTDYGIDYKGCAVLVAYDKQSPDIAQGVDEGKGLNLDQGAGDQGLMFGYAVRRDARADAAADSPCAPPGGAPGAAAQVGQAQVAAARRQVAGHHPLCGRQGREIDTVVLSTQHHPEIEHKAADRGGDRGDHQAGAAQGTDRQEHQLPGQPDRALRGRWSAGRLRPHRPQDHRRHLRRRGAPRRRRVLGQGSVQGRPLGRLCRALRRQEHRRRRPGQALPGAGVLCHRRGQAHQHHGHHLRHRQGVRTRRSRS